MNVWHFLFSIIRRNKFWFIASCVLAMCYPVLIIWGSLYYAKIIAAIGENYHNALSTKVAFLLFMWGVIFVCMVLVQWGRNYVDARLKIRYQRVVQDTLFRQIHKHSLRFFNTEQSGKIIAKASNITFGMQTIFGTIRAFLFTYVAILIAVMCFLVNINAYLGLIIIFLSLIEHFIVFNAYKVLKCFSEKVANEDGKITGILADSIANARLIKNIAAIYHERKKLLQQINKKIRLNIEYGKKNGKINAFAGVVSEVFLSLMLSVVLWFYLTQESMLLEDVVFCVTMIFLIDADKSELLWVFERFQSVIGKINDALALLYRPFDIIDVPNAKKLKVKSNYIDIKNISFSYGKGKTIFKDFNLSIAPNEKIGLVGLSGAGKSTLINLILRAYDLQKGEICVSGQDIAKVTQFSLHQNIALISQEPCLFNRSIMENIRFARPNATDEEVMKAAKMAHIHDTIMRLPSGYESVVGERGVKLSGGERQRIAIAAAILKDTPILILDEATSALDSESETAIEKALQKLMKNKTVIAIAHRLSTLKNMDRIVVLENGKIFENGTQKELLKNKDGVFYRLYKLQSDGYLQV